MKKILFSFILSAAALAPIHADEYTGVLVDNGTQKTYYLFEEQPTVKYTEVGGVMNACLYITGETDPVVSVPLQDGAKLSVSYDAFVRVTLNDAGYATFSAKDPSSIATEGVTAYKAKVDGELITLTAIEGNIPAGTGVLLYGETPGAKVNLPVAASADAVAENDLKPTTLADGSLAAKEANSWALGNDNLFYELLDDAYIPNRAYLVHEKASESNMRIVFADDETTGISNAVSEKSARDGKFMENGRIVILKNGVKYNVAGQTIK